MAEAVPLDRRQRRRRETIEEVLDVAAQVMSDQGVAGLTLGEVARRMGIRPPSLYVYFDSKNALYDALFERGYRELLTAMEAVQASAGALDPIAQAHRSGAEMVRWAVEHPAYAPLMFWRPVPGFAPSEAAYAPAVALSQLSMAFLTDLQARGALDPGADLRLVFRTLTAIISGVVSQQLSNAPGETFESGTFTSTVPDMVAMWLAHFAPPSAERTVDHPVPVPTSRTVRPPGGRNGSRPAAPAVGNERKESR